MNRIIILLAFLGQLGKCCFLLIRKLRVRLPLMRNAVSKFVENCSCSSGKVHSQVPTV